MTTESKQTYPDYTIAIRTLGTAGDKYRRELESIAALTLKPAAVNVYIPHGFALPKEAMGFERYIRCEKGMVAQRALPFEEITTDWILFLDDDIVLPPDGIQELFDCLTAHQSSCVFVNTRELSRSCSLKTRLFQVLVGGNFALSRGDKAERLLPHGKIGFAASPQSQTLPTETGWFQIFLVQTQAHRSVRFADERWMDEFGYAEGDDVLYGYKLFLQGRNPVMHFSERFVHLDAGVGRVADTSRRAAVKLALHYVRWHRMVYSLRRNTTARRIWCAFCCFLFLAEQYVLRALWAVLTGHPAFLWQCPLELVRARRFVRSARYRNLPPFDEVFV